MVEARRANQEYLQARDEMKDALVQKLSYRFGSRQDDDQVSISSAAIRDEVDGLLISAAAPVTQANLARLNRRLERQAQGKRGIDEDSQTVHSISAYTTGSVPQRASGPRSGSMSYRESRPITPAKTHSSGRASARGAGSARGPFTQAGVACGSSALPKAKPPAAKSCEARNEKTLVQDVDWSTLDRLAAKLHEKDAEVQKVREKELQQRLKEDLDKQLIDAKIKQARDKEEDQRYYDKNIKVLGSWQDQEKEVAREARAKALVIQKERDKQLALDRARKEQEKQAAKKEAEEMVQRARREDEQDKQETEQRRLMRKERVQKALQDSCAAAARKEEELKSKIQDEDARMEEHRQRVVERDKKCQEEVWQKVVVRRQMLESIADTRHKAEMKSQDEVEVKAAMERAAKDAAKIEDERRNADRLKDMKLGTQKYILDQMKKKTEVKQQAREEKKTLASALEVDAKKFYEKEVSRSAAQKQRALEHRAELERQIAAKTASPLRKKDAMSSSELAINKKLFERVARTLESMDGGEAI